MSTLLERAKERRGYKTKKDRVLSEQEIQLVSSWLSGELTVVQISFALNKRPGPTYVFLANALKTIINQSIQLHN